MHAFLLYLTMVTPLASPFTARRCTCWIMPVAAKVFFLELPTPTTPPPPTPTTLPPSRPLTLGLGTGNSGSRKAGQGSIISNKIGWLRGEKGSGAVRLEPSRVYSCDALETQTFQRRERRKPSHLYLDIKGNTKQQRK